MRFKAIEQFIREYKKIRKSYRDAKSFDDDFAAFKEAKSVRPSTPTKSDQLLHRTDELDVMKCRFKVSEIRTKRFVRVVYAYHRDMKQIVFLEMYSHAQGVDKVDEKRYRKYARNVEQDELPELVDTPELLDVEHNSKSSP